MSNILGIVFVLNKCPPEWRKEKHAKSFLYLGKKSTLCRCDDEEQPKPGICLQPTRPSADWEVTLSYCSRRAGQHSFYHHAPFWQQTAFIPDAFINKRSRAGSRASTFNRFMPAESYLAHNSLLITMSCLRWPNMALGTDEALFKPDLLLWQRIFWTQLGLPSQLAVVHPAANPPVKPASLQKVRQQICLKLPLLGGKWTFISLLSSPKAGEREETFWHVCCCKMKTDQEGDRQFSTDHSFPHSSTQSKSGFSFRRWKHYKKLRQWFF